MRVRSTTAAIARIDDFQPFGGLVLLGDNVYRDGARLEETVMHPFADALGMSLFAVLGNHDVEGGHAAGQLAALGEPAAGGRTSSATCC